MKNIVLMMLAYIGLQSCCATSIMEFNSNETLIVNHSKVIQHGFFTFIVFINDKEVKELVYIYSIDIKNKKVTCSKSSEQIYSVSDKNRYLRNLDFRTAENFKSTQNNTWREKYYSCFADNFLDMTNDDKIKLLNRLSDN
jgi:hypothetical protein